MVNTCETLCGFSSYHSHSLGPFHVIDFITTWSFMYYQMLFFSQCFGVALDNFQHSSWCCLFTENPIGLKSGSNILIHKPEVQTGCLFGFDPDRNCSQCLSSQRYNLHYTLLKDRSSHSTVVNILLSGDLCTQIGGTFIHHIKMNILV